MSIRRFNIWGGNTTRVEDDGGRWVLYSEREEEEISMGFHDAIGGEMSKLGPLTKARLRDGLRLYIDRIMPGPGYRAVVTDFSGGQCCQSRSAEAVGRSAESALDALEQRLRDKREEAGR